MTVKLTAHYSEPFVLHLSIERNHINQPALPNIHGNYSRKIQPIEVYKNHSAFRGRHLCRLLNYNSV